MLGSTMIVLIGGASGSGKTTVGQVLASQLNWLCVDADSFHPAVNIAKMRSGIALTDADRWPWLRSIGRWMDQQIAAGRSAVMPCSLLKRSYRSLLMEDRPAARLAFLIASRELLQARLAARHGHFFGAKLLDSQLADLELPEPGPRVRLFAAATPPAQLAAEIIAGFGLVASAAPAPERRPGE
jgi:gluconokinase